MNKGEIKFYNPLKGYGFIQGSDEDYFFHISQLPENSKPKIKDKVEFIPIKTKKGWCANGIKIIKK